MKDLAFRTQVKYAAHPYLWISKARAHSTGLGIMSEDRELPKEELPPIKEEAIKIYPMVYISFSCKKAKTKWLTFICSSGKTQ
jgi:hypothetical protein